MTTRREINATHEGFGTGERVIVHRPGQGRPFEVYAYPREVRYEAVVRAEDGTVAEKFPVSAEFYRAAADAAAAFARAREAVGALTLALAREQHAARV